MKRFFPILVLPLFASAAFAADLPSTRPPVAPPLFTPAPVTTWTGFYAGIHAGYASANVSVLDNAADGVNPGPFGYHPTGGFGGGTIGYNYQIGNLGLGVGSGIVVGVEGDVGYLGLKGRGIIGSAAAASHQDLTQSSGVYGDVTGRLGFAIDRFLVYGKGGYAGFGGSASQTTSNPGYSTTGTGSRNGWTAGGGVEYRIAPQISVKAEYLHYDFGTKGGAQTNVGDPTSPPGYAFRNWTSLRLDTVKVGLNYQFNFANPVIAGF